MGYPNGVSHIFIPVAAKENEIRVWGASRPPPVAESREASEWQRPRCSALPVADKAEHKCVPGSIADAAASSARKISGTPNGRQKQRSRSDGKAHTGHHNRTPGTI